MIVIDTNVVFELMRLTPEPAVMAWFSRQDSAELYRAAAIACAGGAAVATRNGADFEHCGITVIDPWAGDRASP